MKKAIKDSRCRWLRMSWAHKWKEDVHHHVFQHQSRQNSKQVCSIFLFLFKNLFSSEPIKTCFDIILKLLKIELKIILVTQKIKISILLSIQIWLKNSEKDFKEGEGPHELLLFETSWLL